MSTSNNLESVSEKRKRGRPADPLRIMADFVTPELGNRGNLNTAYWCRFMGAVTDHPEGIQKFAMGATKAEIMAGANHARGFRTAAVEAARFINAIGWDNAADVVRDRVVETSQERLRQRVRRYIERELDVDVMVERAVARIPKRKAPRTTRTPTRIVFCDNLAQASLVVEEGSQLFKVASRSDGGSEGRPGLSVALRGNRQPSIVSSSIKRGNTDRKCRQRRNL